MKRLLCITLALMVMIGATASADTLMDYMTGELTYESDGLSSLCVYREEDNRLSLVMTDPAGGDAWRGFLTVGTRKAEDLQETFASIVGTLVEAVALTEHPDAEVYAVYSTSDGDPMMIYNGTQFLWLFDGAYEIF